MKIKICTEEGCHNAQTTDNFCRLHYVKNWKKLKEQAQKKSAERLNKYVEGICNKHPDRYMDMIRKDIRSGREGAFDNGFHAEETEVFSGGHLETDESVDRLIGRIKLDKDF